MNIQVVYDTQKEVVVLAEAGGDIVDGIFKLAFASQHKLASFTGPTVGTYTDDGNANNRASQMPLSIFTER